MFSSLSADNINYSCTKFIIQFYIRLIVKLYKDTWSMLSIQSTQIRKVSWGVTLHSVIIVAFTLLVSGANVFLIVVYGKMSVHNS